MADLASGGRPRRADALRNRERLLDAARVALAAGGADVSLDEIARSAGVGSGTLYRHFPTRQALLDGVVSAWLDGLRAETETLAATADPALALSTWLRWFVAHTTLYRGLSAALMAGMDDVDSPLYESCQVLHEIMRTLMARAQEAGAIREDLEIVELSKLVNAIALATERAPDGAEMADRLLTLAMDGLRGRDS